MPMDEIAIDKEPSTPEEIDKATANLNRNKAPGLDKITQEILKDGGSEIKTWE